MDPSIFEDPSNPYWNPEALYGRRGPSSTPTEKGNVFSRLLKLGKSSKNSNNNNNDDRYSRPRPMSYHDVEDFRLSTATKSPVERMLAQKSSKKDVSRSHSWIYGSVKLPSDVPFYDYSPERPSNPSQSATPSKSMDYSPAYGTEYDFLPPHPAQYKGVDPSNWRQYALNESRKHSRVPEKGPEDTTNLTKKLASSVRKLTWKSLKHAVKRRPTLDALKRWPPDQPEGAGTSTEPIYASNYFFPEKKAAAIYASCTNLYGESPQHVTASVRVRPKRTRQSWPDFGPMPNYQSAAPAGAIAANDGDDEEIYHSEWDLRQFMPYDVWLQATDPMMNPPPPTRMPKAKVVIPAAQVQKQQPSSSSAIYGEAIYKQRSNSILQPDVTAYQLLNKSEESPSDSDNLSDNAISEERVRIGGQGIYMVPSVQAPNQPVVTSNPPKIKPPALANNLVLMDAETWTETVKRPSRLESSTPDSKIYGSTTLKTYFSQPISVEPSGKVEPPQDFKNDQRTEEIYGENGTKKSIRFAENSDKFGDNFSTKSGKFSDVKSLKVEGSPEKSVQFAENSPKKSTQFAENSPKKSIKFAETPQNKSIKFPENPDKFNEKDKIKCRESSESSSPSGGGGGGRYIKRRKSRSTNQKSRLMKEVIYEESDDDNDGRESNQVYAVKIIVSQNNTSEYVKPILKKERVYYNEAAGIVVNEQQQQQTTHNTAAESSGEMCEFSLQQQQQQQNSTRKKVQFESNHVIVCADELSDDETEVETGPPDTSDWVEDEQRLSSASSSDNYDTQEPLNVQNEQSLKYENSQQNESKETERQQLYYHLQQQQQEEQEQQRKSQQCELQSHRQPQQHYHQHIQQSHEDEEAEDEVRVEPSRTNDHHQHHHHEPARIEQKLSTAAAPFKANPMDKPAQRNTVKVGPASPPCYPNQFGLNPNSLLFNDTTRLRLNQNRRPSIEQTFKLNISPIETIVVPAHKPRIKHSNSFRQAGSPSLSVLRPREPPPPPPVVSSTVSPKGLLVSTTVSSVPPPPPLPSSTSIQQTLSRISAISPSKGRQQVKQNGSQQVKQNGSQQANLKVSQHGKPNIGREVNSKVSQQGKSKAPQQLYSSSSQALAEKCKAVEKVLSQSYHNQQQQRQSNVTSVTDEVTPCSEIIAPVKTQEQVYGDSKNIEILTRENAVSEIRIYSTTESLNIDRTSGPAQVLATYGTGMSNNKIEEVHYAATEIINPPETVHRRQHSAPPALRPHSSVILIVDNEAIYGDIDHAQYGATLQNSSAFSNSLESKQQVEKTVSRNAPLTDNSTAKTFPHSQLRATPRSGNASSGETEYASRQKQQPAHAQDLEYVQRPVSSIYAQQPKIYEAPAQVQSPQEPSAHELEDNEELDEPLYDDVTGRKLKKAGASTRLLKESKEVIEAGRMVLKYLQNYGTKTYGPTQIAPPIPPPLPSLPPSSEIYTINNNTDNLYNDIEVQVDRNNCYNDSMTYDSRLRDEGIIYDDTLSLLSSTYGRSDRTIMNEDDEEPIYDDVLNLRTGDSDSGAETEDCPPPLPAQGPPKITSEIPTINFPLLNNNNNNRNSVGPAGEQGKRHSNSFAQTLQSELEKRLATLGRSSEYSAYNASAQVASSSESSGVEEDYNPEKNLKADGVDESYRLNAVSKLVTDTISMARGKFLDSMKAANANKDVGFGAGKSGDDDEEPIYEEIGGDAHRNTSPLYSDAFDAKSIFKGASKNEILSFLESIRDQLSAASVADSNQSDSRSSSLSRDETFNRRVIVGMERNDSGIGSESGSLTAPTPHPTSPLCKDCNGLPTTETPDDTPNLCQTCTRKRSERKEILQEILKTELNYGRDLKIIRDEFYHPIKITGLCTPEQLEQIFLNVDQLIEINVGLTSELKRTMDEAEAVRDEDLSSVNVGKIFMDCADVMMNAFETYCRHQANAGTLLTQLEKEKELLRIFLRVSQMENAVLRRMNLPAFLMVPVQRVTRYPLLLARLLKVTPSEHISRSELSSAQLKIEQHLEQMNKSTREAASVRLWRKISIRNGSSSPVHRRAGSDLDGAGAKKWPWF